MSRFFCFFLLFTCACMNLQAQVNFVKNPGLEEYSKCPTDWNQIFYSKYWSNAIDSDFTWGMEYYNRCAGVNIYAGLPSNGGFYQDAHGGNGIAGFHLFYDKTTPYPPTPLPRNYRDYLQGRLIKHLEAGKEYCVAFYVNMAEASGYAHDKIGAYLDDGSFDDTVSVPGSEMTFVIPQVFTNTVISDTAAWVKIEGSFVAKGNEEYISIGNFFKNEDLTTVVTNYWATLDHYSYYLIDDISVIPLDLPAKAGDDTWVRKGDSVLIGRANDTTAIGLDCKWYRRGNLIDSGETIWAKGYGMVGDKDTYSVVQTICGIVKTDTVVVYTASVGIPEIAKEKQFTIFPNPSNGQFVISGQQAASNVSAVVTDMVGRQVWNDNLKFSNGKAEIKLDLPTGVYTLTLSTQGEQKQQNKITISSTE